MEKLKQRKLEQRHKRFIDGCIDWIDDQIGPRYVSTRSGWRYDDLRPFKWNEFDVRPSYTYVVDLNVSKDDVMERFSRTTRRRIRNNLEEEYTVEDGGKKAIEWIIQRVNERYEEQGETTPITAAFVMDLYDRLQSGQVHPYVLKIDGEIITGTILLEYGETAQRWQGGVKTNGGLPANELLEWHMMCDAMDRGITSYEIVDANFPRLNEWKTKFGPDARAYYSMMRASSGMNAAVRIYEQIRERNLIP